MDSEYDSEEEYNAKHALRNQANLIQNEKQSKLTNYSLMFVLENSTLVELTTNLSRSLSLLKLSLNSPQFFKELIEEHGNLIRKVKHSLVSFTLYLVDVVTKHIKPDHRIHGLRGSPFVHLCKQVDLIISIQHINTNESRQETLNKTSFIKNKPLMVFQKLKARLF